MLKKELTDSLPAFTALAAFIIPAVYLLVQDVASVGPL